MAVSMKTSIQGEFGRIQIAVLNPKLTPIVLSVVIGNRWFDVKLVVENEEDGKGGAVVEDDNGENDDLDFEDQDDMEDQQDFDTQATKNNSMDDNLTAGQGGQES